MGLNIEIKKQKFGGGYILYLLIDENSFKLSTSIKKRKAIHLSLEKVEALRGALLKLLRNSST